jgi:hypothetical protein
LLLIQVLLLLLLSSKLLRGMSGGKGLLLFPVVHFLKREGNAEFISVTRTMKRKGTKT